MKTRTPYTSPAAKTWCRLIPGPGIMAALLLAATGCATVYETSPGALDGLAYKAADGTPSELVFITTTGYHMLWTIPLACGDVRWNETTKNINGGSCLFKDLVGATELQDALLKLADSRNCDVVDMRFYDSDTTYAGVSTGGAIGALFGSSQIGISGVFVPRKDKTQEGVSK